MNFIRKLRVCVAGIFVFLGIAALQATAVAQTLPVTAVGRTPGDASVLATGRATYQIPVWVPPGIRGIQPKLALSYSSQGGDGLIGPGWSISGLSRISRCQRNIEQDGYREAVLLSMADAFCIDGRRLRLTSAAGTYGAPNSTYQTEVADYSLVVANGTTGNGPTWFEVKAPDGLIYEFGNSSTSRAVLSGTTTPYLWALSKVRDRQGNNMRVTYAQSGGTLAPSLIEYTQTTASGTTYPYSVSFTYGTRDTNDRTIGYIAGAQFIVGAQLLQIDVSRGSTLARRYRLSYSDSPTTQRARLAALQECAGTSGTDCLAPSLMTYQDGAIGVANPTTPGGAVQGTGPRLVDLNGDARADLLYYQTTTSTITWFVNFANSSGGFGPTINLTGTIGDGRWVLVDDFLGDGQLGMLESWATGSRLVRWNGTAFTSYTTTQGLDANAIAEGGFPIPTSADINGDGKADLVWGSKSGGVASLYTRLNTSASGVLSFSSTTTAAYPISHNPPSTYFMGVVGNNSLAGASRGRADFNGDGRDDVILSQQANGSLQAGTTLISQGAVFATGFPLLNDGIPQALNFNNDACTDVVTSTVYISPCNGSAGAVIQTFSLRRAIIDWNSDGRDDIIIKTGANWYVLLSEGASLTSTTIPISINDPYDDVFLTGTDHDGDGVEDLVVFDQRNGQTYYGLHNGQEVVPDLLTGVADGLGNSNQYTYKSITRSNYTRTYTGMPAIAAPDFDFYRPTYVVDQLTSSDGNGGSYQTQFHYYSARMSAQGRGFKGFAMRRSRDSRTGLYTYDEYRQDFPYIGGISSQKLYQSNNTTLIQSRANTFNSTILDSSSANGRRFTYVSQSVDKVYEVGGAFNGSHILTKTSTNQFDSFGTLIDQTSTTTEVGTGLNAGAVHTERIQQLSVQNDVINWCLNRPTTVQQARSHTLAGGVEVVRTTGLAWDLVNCRLTESVVEPSNSQWRVSTQLDYDAFGNVDSIVVTPATGQGQSARTSLMDWGADGQFPRTVTNPKSQVATLGWDQLRGVRSAITDISNQTTTWSYDNFGRLVLETRPEGTTTAFNLSVCNLSNSYCGASSLRYKVETTQRDSANSTIRVDASYFDALDRVRRVDQPVLGGGTSSVVTNYDARGRVSAQSTPFLAGDPVWYTNYVYDSLDRLSQVERQASETDTSLATTLITYQGLRTTVTDPLGHASGVVRDAIGQVIQALDAAGNDTDYEYDAFGNLARTRDFYGNESSFAYNVRGMKMSSVDLDKGAWSYNYFPLGELKSQTTARNQTSTFTYDLLSRPLTRIEPEGTTTWTWDVAANGVGQLATLSSPGSYSETYAYDTYGRTTQVNYVADGTTYTFNSSYSATTGLPDTLTYPTSTSSTRVKLRYYYQNGIAQSVRDYTGNVLGTVYWQANSTDAGSQIIDEQLGNGLRTISSYDRITGSLESRTTGPGGGATRQNSEYYWDKVGNLTQRRELNLGLTESFYYDALDRLDYSQLNGVTNLDVAYDAIGNITSKTGVGSYTYHATKKHAVVAAGSNTYTYDANGNMMTRNGASLAWASYDLPTTINQSDGEYSQFSYGADRSRYKQVSYSTTFGTETTIYVAGLFERVTRSSGTEYKHYISTPSGRVALINRKSTGTNEVSYLLRDHLGSTEMITNSSGGQLTRLSSDAFGKRRNGGSWAGTPAASAQTAIYNTTHQGFTGLEHLDNLDLVHMNGRVYDSVLGRFMSADPLTPDLYSSQGLNRYSYVSNNPLRFTDPSGFCGGDFALPCNIPVVSLRRTPPSYRDPSEFSDRRCVLRGTCPDYQTGRPVAPPQQPPPGTGGPGPVTPPPGTGTPPPVTVPGPAAGVSGLGGFDLAFVGPLPALATQVAPVSLATTTVVVAPAFLLTGDSGPDRGPLFYAAYTRFNPATGKTYAGRTSGFGNPANLVRIRGLQQTILNAEGFLPPVLDKYASDDPRVGGAPFSFSAYFAIRGREQQLIDFYGGAQSVGGSARNMINGVSDFSPLRPFYIDASITRFGPLPDNSPPRPRF